MLAPARAMLSAMDHSALFATFEAALRSPDREHLARLKADNPEAWAAWLGTMEDAEGWEPLDA